MQPPTHRAGTIRNADFLEVNAIGLQFPQMRVHISKKKGGAVQAKLVEETNGGRGDRIPYPFVLEPRGQIAYFDAREQVNIVAMIIVRGFRAQASDCPALPRSASAPPLLPLLLLSLPLPRRPISFSTCSLTLQTFVLTVSVVLVAAAQPHSADDGFHGADGLGNAKDDGEHGPRGAQEDARRDGRLTNGEHARWRASTVWQGEKEAGP